MARKTQLFILVMLLILIISCSFNPGPQAIRSPDSQQPNQTEVADIISIDEELDTKSLESLESGLSFIENI